jgi:hypothetical protein
MPEVVDPFSGEPFAIGIDGDTAVFRVREPLPQPIERRATRR